MMVPMRMSDRQSGRRIATGRRRQSVNFRMAHVQTGGAHLAAEGAALHHPVHAASLLGTCYTEIVSPCVGPAIRPFRGSSGRAVVVVK
jgi:hypothetical protein